MFVIIKIVVSNMSNVIFVCYFNRSVILYTYTYIHLRTHTYILYHILLDF